ncbi:hypothetical protein CDAR_50691 [Caerostris darwini]|uniref:Uncharacterized protein n=1 Tax=Caerostris darwini TaxID=1538125 RepID=A0AAV4UX19_9ARAC|nr:hypothetical protein CDAR_50691 [Caerostris darwini]
MHPNSEREPAARSLIDTTAIETVKPKHSRDAPASSTGGAMDIYKQTRKEKFENASEQRVRARSPFAYRHNGNRNCQAKAFQRCARIRYFRKQKAENFPIHNPLGRTLMRSHFWKAYITASE